MNDKQKTERTAECNEAIDYLEKGVHVLIMDNKFGGAQISTVFKIEVLERIDLHAIRNLVPANENGDQQFIDWVASKQFNATKIDAKRDEFGTVTCVGCNETGRLFSKEWIERMLKYGSSIQTEMKSVGITVSPNLILNAVYAAWIQFAVKWETKVSEESDTPKGITKKQHIAQLRAEKAVLEAKLAEKEAAAK